LTSTTSTFTKEEWLTILTLSVKWHFHEARKLAIKHLDSLLTDVELILVGRAAYVSRWVVQGYHALIDRPLDETITEEEGDIIGNREVNRLWAIRCHQLALMPPNPGYVARELSSRFSEELVELAAREEEHRTKAEIDEEERLEEERRTYERQLREREELEQERMRIEDEDERRRIEDEEAQRLWFEEEARKIHQAGADYHEPSCKEGEGRVADERERDWTSDESEGEEAPKSSERSVHRIASGPLAFALTKKRLTPEELEQWRRGRKEEMEERRRSGLEWLARRRAEVEQQRIESERKGIASCPGQWMV
jgi:hypothetical protein